MSPRPAAVAGLFYPADSAVLRGEVHELLDAAPEANIADQKRLRGLILPHAGYDYSGPVAAIGYRWLCGQQPAPHRILLLGPSHRVPLRGIALPSASSFRSPLGDVPVDRAGIEQLRQLPNVSITDAAHAFEHSLEVHLPFLQIVIGEFSVLPLVVGAIAPEELGQIIDAVWDADTFPIVSSDLSHFLCYDAAAARDRRTSELIEARSTTLNGDQACGCYAVNGMLQLASARELTVKTLALCNSGDTAGDKDRVVGYGAYGLFDPC